MNRAVSVGNFVMPPRENYGGTYQNNSNKREEYEKRDNRPRFNRKDRDIGFKRLEEIYEQNPDQIILTLEKQENGFDKMIQNDMTPDKLVLVMRLVKKLCESAYKENTGKILAMLCCAEFLNRLKSYVQDINLQDANDKYKNTYFWKDTEQFWDSVLVFYETLINVRPNMACDSLPKLVRATVCTIRDFEENVSEEIKTKLEEIQAKLIICQEEREKKKIVEEKMKIGLIDEYPDPPDNFRYE